MVKLSNISINIHFLEAIQEIPGYAKLMKKLIYKKKLIEGDTTEVTYGSSVIMSSKIAEKKERPEAFTIPCSIGTHRFMKSLCNLGASINLMPFVIYKTFGLDTPIPISMRLLLADQSIKMPVKILFDVLVKVDKFILSVDFVVLDYEMDQEVPIILGRPLFAIKRDIVDLELGEMRFRVHEDEAYKCEKKRCRCELKGIKRERRSAARILKQKSSSVTVITVYGRD
ncbi:uncharacterized protein LOC107865293 [Capsicum annuum]|uniref:uncharacterized protein LOC107865293 n=1 Tax=Capsicum annuum TaxID=4072 RepID=UPI0007BF1E55|nr:uncharacterized protein LOC107865293 [Capsicum annuum]